jgi:hypothetical protein
LEMKPMRRRICRDDLDQKRDMRCLEPATARYMYSTYLRTYVLSTSICNSKTLRTKVRTGSRKCHGYERVSLPP